MQLPGNRMIRQQFLRLLPYQVLMLVVNSVNEIVDGIIASNLIGGHAMSAIGLYGPINHLLYAVSITLVSGSQILCGRCMAKNEHDSLDQVFSVNLAFSAIVSLITAAAMLVMVRFGFTSFLVSGGIELEALNEYFRGMALGVPGLVLGQQVFAFLSLENRTRRTMAATLVCVAVNTAGDFLFVSGLRMGTFGLALASVLSFWAFFGVMAVYYLTGKSSMHFHLRGLRWQHVGSMIKLGYPGAVSRFLEMFRCIIINALILKVVGSAGLSSFAASNSVMSVFWALPFGMTAVNRMFLSISIGEEDRQVTRDTIRTVIRTGLLIILTVDACLVLCAVPITRMFFHDPSEPVFQMTVTAFRLLPLCMPFSVVQQAFACYYQTMEKKLFATVLPIVNGAVHVVLFSMLLMPSLQMTGLYLANILNGVMCVLLVVLFSACENRRVPRNMDDLLAMPAGFGIPEKDTLNFAVRNMDDVMEISRRVEAFCLEKGADKKHAMLAGLALEEMAGNVVEHGFGLKKAGSGGRQGSGEGREVHGRHLAEIRVSVKGRDIILRIRDNCRPFDPGERLRMEEDRKKNAEARAVLAAAADVQLNIGLRLVYGLTDSVKYDNVLGLNVLLIRL